MCLILFANQVHPNYPLIVVANRDESYPRPTAAADWWDDNLLAGKDLKSGGTWMGITKTGRFAALTNFRDGFNVRKNVISRGELVKNYLTQRVSSLPYLQQIQQDKDKYNGFSLLVGDAQGLHYYSNKGGRPYLIPAGIHGLSNSFLDVAWPKVEHGKAGLTHLVSSTIFDVEAAFQLMQNRTIANDEDLPQTNIPLFWERLLSSMYIQHDNYGTRCTTLILIDKIGNVLFEERSYVPKRTQRYVFQIKK